MNISQGMKIERHSNAVAVGTSTITPTNGINRAGFGTCLFAVLWGSITDAPSIKVQQSDDDGDADAYSDLLGSSVAVLATDDDKITWVEVSNSSKKWLKLIVTRGGATGSVVDGIVALLTDYYREPVTQPAEVSGGEFHDRPAEGTA